MWTGQLTMKLATLLGRSNQ